MPRAPTRKKQETHERIVRTAAAAIRKHGYDGVSVADVMAEAGLTHGGFYAHFADRDAMLAEAVDVAGRESLDRLGKATDAVPRDEALAALVDSYLSDRHVAAPERGCALAALGSETRRQSSEVRRVVTRRVRELVDLVARQQPDWGAPGNHDAALASMCTLVGALVVARAVDDPALAKDVRRAARAAVVRKPRR